MSNKLLGKVEWMTAAAVTLWAACAHVMFARNAGPLWRDEVGTVNLATSATWREFWAAMEFESYPALWPALLRGLWSMGLVESDRSLRVVGMVVSLGVLGAFWVAARSMMRRPPLLALVLVGAAPAMIRWGGSLRAWGFGVLMMLLMLAAVWRMLRRPTARRIALAAVASVLAVQAVYYNAVVLAALMCGAMVLAWQTRRWRSAGALLGISLLSAASLLPYVGLIRRAAEWRMLTRLPHGDKLIAKSLQLTLNMPGAWCVWMWLLIACVAGVLMMRSHRRIAWFAWTATAAAMIGHWLLMQSVGIVPNAWYFLVLMALAATAADVGFAAQVQARWARIALVVIAALLSASATWQAAHTLQSNVRVYASNMSQQVTAKDLIVVTPWWFGMSFDRYYKGEAKWITMPMLSDHRSYRADLMKQQMARADAIKPVLERIEATLRGGGRVMVLGWFERTAPGRLPVVLRPAPDSQFGWLEQPYVVTWNEQLMYLAQGHAQKLTGVGLDIQSPINEKENVNMFIAQGWTDARRR